MRKLIGLISLVVIGLSGFAQEFTAKLPMGNKLKVGEPLELELVFRYPSNSNDLPVLQNIKKNSYLSDEIEVLEIDEERIADDGAVIEVRKRLQITVWAQGLHKIPPFSIYYAGDSLYSQSLDISTPEIKIDLKQAPKDIKGIYEADWNTWDEIKLWFKNYWWVILSLVLLLFGFLWLKNYLKKIKENALSPLSEMSAEDLAYLMLSKIEESESWKKGEIKTYYTQISEVIWKYLEMHFNVPTSDQTSNEIIDKVKQTAIPKERIKDLQEIFTSADLVKFAKSSPSEQEHELIMLKTRKFVDQTKHIPYRGHE